MKDWRPAVIGPTASILDALAAIQRGSLQIALALDTDQRLLGVVTDGDIRKHILKGVSLDSPVAPLMNTNPVTAALSESRDQLLVRMRARRVHQLPLIDGDGRVAGVTVLNDL